MLAWGLSNRQFAPESFAQKAREAGYAWAALEYDAFENHNRWPDFRLACWNARVLPGVWFTQAGNIAYAPTSANFAIAELEGQADYDGLMLAIDRRRLPSCPLAVVTNFDVPLVDNGVPVPEKAAPLIAAGFECLTESYLGDNPNATPEELDFRARQLGWTRSAPVFGVWNKPVDEYAGWFTWPGWSAYLAEYVLA